MKTVFTQEEMQSFFSRNPANRYAAGEMHKAFLEYYQGRGEANTVISAAAAVVAEMTLLADDPSVYERKTKTVEPSQNVLNFLEMAAYAIGAASTKVALNSPTFEELVAQSRVNADKPFALTLDPYYDPQRQPEYQAVDFRDTIISIAQKHNLDPWERAACSVIVGMNMAQMSMQHIDPAVFTHEIIRQTMIGMAFKRPLSREEVPVPCTAKLDYSDPVQMAAINITSLLMQETQKIMAEGVAEKGASAGLLLSIGSAGAMMGKETAKISLEQNKAPIFGLIPAEAEAFYNEFYPVLVSCCEHPLERNDQVARYQDIAKSVVTSWETGTVGEGSEIRAMEDDPQTVSPYKLSEELKPRVEQIIKSCGLTTPWQSVSAYAGAIVMLMAQEQSDFPKSLLMQASMTSALMATCRTCVEQGFTPKREDLSFHVCPGRKGLKPSVN